MILVILSGCEINSTNLSLKLIIEFWVQNRLESSGEINMRQVISMKEIFRIILRYEFETGYCGLQTSEFTSEIIEAEAKRLSKHRKPLETNKVYALVKSQKRNRLIECDSLDEAVNKVNNSLNTAYIIESGKVIVPIFDEPELGSENITTENNIGVAMIVI